MAEMSVIWLRVAVASYSIGLLHAILTLVRRREHLFRAALGAFSLGTVFHFVSIIEEGILRNRCPIGTFYELLSMCAFLVALLFLGVFIFPLVFVMTLVATFGAPVSRFSSTVVTSVWLTAHIVFVLLGYAALLFTAVGSLLYLFQERELKSKKRSKFYNRLPALGTLDELISRGLGLGFVLITLAILAGSTWAFLSLQADWIRQPQIAISFLTWGVYLALVCLRVTAGWRGRKAAIMTVAVACFSAITWAAHAQLGRILFKQ